MLVLLVYSSTGWKGALVFTVDGVNLTDDKIVQISVRSLPRAW